MAAQSPTTSSSGMRGGRVVGDYMFGQQVGSGSYSVVWLARHRVRGTEVAVKEIVMDRLSKKLQDSLLSEIVILQRINHPNIISLHDIIKASGRIYLVLEYCRGGDLSVYIQRHGKASEATAKHFMQQLAAGLQVLRENNLIHRDLKPQNLLLSTNDENAVLKIADFGFARSLQPLGLAETLCGSPLYMAPEIMQLQKYDAKADLWSVGAILFQLVTGKTPFTGNNQLQLLQNIVRSNELRFPPDIVLSYDCIDLCQKLLRRNPVERLTFEEFFNHQFLSHNLSNGSLSRTSSDGRDGFPLVEYSPAQASGETSQEDCMPFLLDDISVRHDRSPSVATSKPPIRSTYGFAVENRKDKSPACSPSKNTDILSRYSSTYKLEASGSRHGLLRPVDENVEDVKLTMEQKPIRPSSKDSAIVDSLEFIDQEYVLVPGPPLDLSSSSVSGSRPWNGPCKSESSPVVSPNFRALSAPMPINVGGMGMSHAVGSMESRSSPVSGASQGSMDLGDALEQPSNHCLTRIKSFQQCASVISELVNEKIEKGRRLEALSVQLVILAIWRQALDICHAQAASVGEDSPIQHLRTEERFRRDGPVTPECISSILTQQEAYSVIEREFLLEVGHAEDITKDIGLVDGTAEMPDAMEIIFQSALILGRDGAVAEMRDNLERAASQYSKAVCLLYFLLVEAPSLILSPPFSLTNTDRYRLRTYIDVLNNRQSQFRSQRMALLKCVD